MKTILRDLRGYGVLVATMALLVIGCSTKAPTQAPEDNEVIAELVAGTLGYDGNGLAAVVSDVITIEDTDAPFTIAGATDNSSNNVISRAVDLTPASVRNTGPDHSVAFSRRHDFASVFSDWELSYKFLANKNEQRSPARKTTGHWVQAETHANGTFRNSRLKIQGESRGTFELVEQERTQPASVVLKGEYRYDGNATLLARNDASLTDVSITVNWERLSIIRDKRDKSTNVRGRADINVISNGPGGIVSRNGTITFDGSERAIMEMGGREYLIDIQTADYIGRL